MTKEQFATYQDSVFQSLKKLREAGQKEYTNGEDAFGNFNRLAEQLQMDRKKILWVYFMKHIDGILSYLNGQVSQREPIEGRIDDAMVYLTLLRGMIGEEDKLATIDPNTSNLVDRKAYLVPEYDMRNIHQNQNYGI